MTTLVLDTPGDIKVQHGAVERQFKNAAIVEIHPYGDDEVRYEIHGTELAQRVNPNGAPRIEEVEVVVGLVPENLVSFEEI